MTASLTTAARELHEFNVALSAHIDAAKREEARLRDEIRARRSVLEMSAAGIDFEKVAIAKTIISVGGTYVNGGDDRASVVADAIRQLATGAPIRQVYGDLWRVRFGTKSYDRWHGQRCDCDYGMGPSHGSIIFAVGLTNAARKRPYADLTPPEIEAAIYYLTNLARVQAAEADAKAKAAA